MSQLIIRCFVITLSHRNMSALHSIFGMDNFYEPYKSSTKTLSSVEHVSTPSKRIELMKVVPAKTSTGGMNCGYMNSIYWLKSFEVGCFCHTCSKRCEFQCPVCKDRYYCDEKCQLEDARVHKYSCTTAGHPTPTDRINQRGRHHNDSLLRIIANTPTPTGSSSSLSSSSSLEHKTVSTAGRKWMKQVKIVLVEKKDPVSGAENLENIIISDGIDYPSQYFDGWVVIEDVKHLRPDETISSEHMAQLRAMEKS